MRSTQGGRSKASFSLATSERWVDTDGNRQVRTEWHNIVVWGKLAEICGQYLKKGRLVCIEGRIQTREYDDRDGVKRKITEIVANEMHMLETRSSQETASGGAPMSQGHPDEPARSRDVVLTDDDIPF